MRGERPLDRSVLGCCAVIGICLNIAMMFLLIEQTHSAQWVYHDLMQNSRAYGREISPPNIALLNDPHPLFVSCIAALCAAGFGLLLAIHLLVACFMTIGVSSPGWQRLRQYRRWKPVGVVLTICTLSLFGTLNSDLWIRATRHILIGSDSPMWIVEDAVFIACALLPWWWIGDTGSRNWVAG